MKKTRCLILLYAVIVFALSGCEGTGSASRVTVDRSAGVAEVLEAGMAEADKATDAKEASVEADNERQSGLVENAPSPEPADEMNDTPAGEEGVDVDLTVLSSTMVYGEVYNMMVAPESYVGKTVKMDGLFSAFHDEAKDKYYFACIIQDATACCAQGIEFELTDEYSYPDDYPEEGGDICVVGVFDTYEEDGYKYCTLRNARLGTVS